MPLPHSTHNTATSLIAADGAMVTCRGLFQAHWLPAHLQHRPRVLRVRCRVPHIARQRRARHLFFSQFQDQPPLCIGTALLVPAAEAAPRPRKLRPAKRRCQPAATRCAGGGTVVDSPSPRCRCRCRGSGCGRLAPHNNLGGKDAFIDCLQLLDGQGWLGTWQCGGQAC